RPPARTARGSWRTHAAWPITPTAKTGPGMSVRRLDGRAAGTHPCRMKHKEESDETGNLYARGADTYRPGRWESHRRSRGRRTRSATGDVRLPARRPVGARCGAERPDEPLRPAATERRVARSARAATEQAHHHWHQLPRACRRGWP